MWFCFFFTELLQLLQNREHVISDKPDADSSSPGGKMTSTSDYYSLEVSPVSDISAANTAAAIRHRHPVRRGDATNKQACASLDFSSSSGGYSAAASTVVSGGVRGDRQRYQSASSLRLGQTTPDLDTVESGEYRSLWQQFRCQQSGDDGRKLDCGITSQGAGSSPEGRLALYDADAIEVLAPEPDFTPRRLQSIHYEVHSPRDDNFHPNINDYVNLRHLPFEVHHSSLQQNKSEQTRRNSDRLLTIDTSMPAPVLIDEGRVFSQTGFSPHAHPATKPQPPEGHLVTNPQSNSQSQSDVKTSQRVAVGSLNDLKEADSAKPMSARVSLTRMELIKHLPMMDEEDDMEQNEENNPKPTNKKHIVRQRLRNFMKKFKKESHKH